MHGRRLTRFTRHLGIAYGSAVETGELLQLGIDAGVITAEPVVTLLRQARRAERLAQHGSSEQRYEPERP